MRLRVSDPDLVSDLLRYLQQRPDVVGGRVSEDELEISLLGSRRRVHGRLELDRRLREWRADHPEIDVDILD